MDIGHSRLLKFLLKEPKMEKHTLKIENLRPTDIESEVPRHQKLREALEPTVETKEPRLETVQNVSDGKLTLKQGDTVETYAPVIMVKTVESKFGKEGLRFQKKTVTEDISVQFQHLFKKEVKPAKTVVTQIQRFEYKY
ncbi:uncharacterized protein LOC134676462 [Cydia fagiglandana]|uniref:uncharacterized protein LOC134676462 n=1 Tax=Cydia fagiglandana TaxID=1458189 RepID=UPI002FEDED72